MTAIVNPQKVNQFHRNPLGYNMLGGSLMTVTGSQFTPNQVGSRCNLSPKRVNLCDV